MRAVATCSSLVRYRQAGPHISLFAHKVASTRLVAASDSQTSVFIPPGMDRYPLEYQLPKCLLDQNSSQPFAFPYGIRYQVMCDSVRI